MAQLLAFYKQSSWIFGTGGSDRYACKRSCPEKSVDRTLSPVQYFCDRRWPREICGNFVPTKTPDLQSIYQCHSNESHLFGNFSYMIYNHSLVYNMLEYVPVHVHCS